VYRLIMGILSADIGKNKIVELFKSLTGSFVSWQMLMW